MSHVWALLAEVNTKACLRVDVGRETSKQEVGTNGESERMDT